MVRLLLLLILLSCLAGSMRLGMTGRGQARTPDDTPLKLPPGWKASDPLPLKKTNCVRCHLTAGRELTVPVRDFARSVHDRVGLSCNDCHGGNTEEDSSAHEAQHGFIGTKLSAHMAACAECHNREAQAFRKSKHYWDLSKRINRAYPVCVDCHGNHDVGRPPAEFSLTNVCGDCHKKLASEMPAMAAIVAENDRLWTVLRKVHARNANAEDPTPAGYRDELDRVRSATARFLHSAHQLTAVEADTLNGRVQRLRKQLETWLSEQK